MPRGRKTSNFKIRKIYVNYYVLLMQSLLAKPLFMFGYSYSRIGSNSTVAISAGTAQRLLERGLHNLGGHERRIQTYRPRRGGEEVGREKIETQHEL